MKILYFSHYCNRPQDGFVQACNQLSRHWQAMGHEVLIVSSSFSHTRKSQPQPGFETIDGLHYLWLKTPKYSKSGVWRALGMPILAWQIFRNRKTLYKEKPDVIIVSTPNNFNIFPARHIAKKTHAKLVYEIRDLWPLTPKELGHMPSLHPFAIILQIAENYAYKHCDVCISVLPCVHEHVKAHGLNLQKLHIVPNGIVENEWNDTTPLNDNLIACLQNLKSKYPFLVCFSGAHGTANALYTLLDTALLLESEGIGVVLIGNGQEKNALKAYAQQKNIHNVHFLDPVAKSNIPLLLEWMDVLYIGLNRTPLFRFGISPNKIFDYMMAAKPIIMSIDAGNDLIQEAQCGLSVQPEDPQAAAQAIRTFKGFSIEQRKALGENGRRYVLAHHTYSVLAKRFLECLQK